MVRTRSQRAAMLLRLPTDVLFKIASHVVAPHLVVAAGKSLEARTALRKGTDAAPVRRHRPHGTRGGTGPADEVSGLFERRRPCVSCCG